MNKDILKLASASSSIDPSQGLLHVNKIVKHLLWHLLPLNIHKPVSTGKHPQHRVSWPSPSEYSICKSVLCRTWRTSCQSFSFGSLHGTHYLCGSSCLQIRKKIWQNSLGLFPDTCRQCQQEDVCVLSVLTFTFTFLLAPPVHMPFPLNSARMGMPHTQPWWLWPTCVMGFSRCERRINPDVSGTKTSELSGKTLALFASLSLLRYGRKNMACSWS